MSNKKDNSSKKSDAGNSSKSKSSKTKIPSSYLKVLQDSLKMDFDIIHVMNPIYIAGLFCSFIFFWLLFCITFNFFSFNEIIGCDYLKRRVFVILPGYFPKSAKNDLIKAYMFNKLDRIVCKS